MMMMSGRAKCPCCHGRGFLLVRDMVMGRLQKHQCTHCDGCGEVEVEVSNADLERAGGPSARRGRGKRG